MLLFILSISIFGVIQTHGQCDFSLLKVEVSGMFFFLIQNLNYVSIQNGQNSSLCSLIRRV